MPLACKQTFRSHRPTPVLLLTRCYQCSGKTACSCAAHLAVEAARAVWQADVHLQGRGIPARRHSAECSTGQTSRRCRLSMEWQQLPRMQGHCSVGDCIQQQAT